MKPKRKPNRKKIITAFLDGDSVECVAFDYDVTMWWVEHVLREWMRKVKY